MKITRKNNIQKHAGWDDYTGGEHRFLYDDHKSYGVDIEGDAIIAKLEEHVKANELTSRQIKLIDNILALDRNKKDRKYR